MNISETDGAIMSDVKPVAWGLFARVDGKFVLQHPVRFSREYCERDVKMYGPDLVWNIQPLIAGGEVTALQAEIEALRKDAERLEVLIKAITPSGQLVCGCFEPGEGGSDWIFIDSNGDPLTEYHDTAREAIDAIAAIAKEK